MVKKYAAALFWGIIFPCFSLLFSQETQLYVTDKNDPNIVYTRSYYLHLPAGYSDSTAYPLVLGFHGRGGAGETWSVTPQWTAKADAEKFIVAFPSGIDGLWNIGGPGYAELTNNRDDVEFVSVLIDTLRRHYKIDSSKIFVTGVSLGGFMVYHLGVELSHIISAIGPVAGRMAYFGFEPEYPLAIVHFHSLYDPVVLYEGAFIIPVHYTLQLWANENNCNPRPDTVDVAFGVKKISWHALDSHGDIDLYTIANSSHEWPSTGIKATDVIWEFFKNHSKDYSTSVPQPHRPAKKTTFHLSQNYPNPFNPSTTIPYNLPGSSHVTLTIYDLAGRQLETLVNGFQSAGKHQIVWQANGLSNGVYFYRLQTEHFSETRRLILLK